MEALAERYPREKPTQQRLAALAGVKQPSVNDWHDRYPSMDTAVRLATNLGVCVEWLLTERGPKHPPKATQDDLGSLAAVWPQLDEQQRAQIARYADFLKEEG